MAKPQTNNNRKNNRLSAEPWEVEYFHQQLPTFSQEELSHVIETCKHELHGAVNRKAILDCVRKKLA